MYFHQWDTDKYETLGNFLLNNYRQALELVCDIPTCITTLLSGRHVSDTKFVLWLEDEHKYLQSKQAEPERDLLGLKYVELLDKYEHAW